MLEKFNYNIPFTKSDGCVLINAKAWEDNTSQLIQSYNMKGERCISYINKVLKVNLNKEVYGEPVKEGDLVFISRQASRVSYLQPYKLPNSFDEYANVHILQVIGKFENNEISFRHFSPLFDKVFMKEVKTPTSSLFLTDNKTNVAEVIKVGSHGFTSDWKPKPNNCLVGNYVLYRDNVVTEITLEGKDYIATTDAMIVGYFRDKNDLSVDNLVLYGNNILLEVYEEENIEGSILIKPNKDEKDDLTELYSDPRFKVVNVARDVKDIKKGDKVIVDMIHTNYVTIDGKRYYLLDGSKNIVGTYE